jgi:hypothetical protein
MDDTIDVASGQMAAQLCKTPLYKLVPPVESNLYLDVDWGEIPLDRPRKRRHVHTLGDVNTLGHFVDVLQGSLDTVENGTHNTWSQLDGQRFASSQHRISDCDARSLFVHLDGGHLALQPNNFSDQLGVADAHQLVHS